MTFGCALIEPQDGGCGEWVEGYRWNKNAHELMLIDAGYEYTLSSIFIYT